MRILVFFFFLFAPFLASAGTGQKPLSKHVPLIIKADSSAVRARHFSEKEINEYKTSKDFDYSYNDAPGASLWDRFWKWFWHLFDGVNSKAIPGGFWKYLFLILGLSGLVYIVLKLMGMDALQLLTGKSKSIEIPYEESLENIHEISFDEEIERAVSNKNYRLAVRLLYLNCLKKLNDRGFINWQLDKTNAAYISEINHPDKQQQFKNLTLQFEYIWYGDFPVDGNGYQHVNNSFHDFNQRLS
ncbi:MAG: hypothetical protein K0S09_2786 [Sphingobacteriaceae bacterium]|jgi:hypothetical protein|nr:hypothetical protein [Sphingobacteriaceae bacterium]